jgi:hypothetical protein
VLANLAIGRDIPLGVGLTALTLKGSTSTEVAIRDVRVGPELAHGRVEMGIPLFGLIQLALLTLKGTTCSEIVIGCIGHELAHWRVEIAEFLGALAGSGVTSSS